MQWLRNFLEHPKTTISGIWGGGAVLAGLAYMANAMHCDVGLLNGQVFMGLLAAVMAPVVAGGSMTDNPKV